jgi:hypothetical protein
MTNIKNMAYWRAKNGCGSKGSYDGGSPDLKANRSPMRMDPMTAMTLASTLKDAKGKEDSKGLDIMSMSPTPQKKTYPKSYTKKDIEFLKKQREDVVRYEDLDAKGREIWKKQGKPVPKKPSSKPPLKQRAIMPDYIMPEPRLKSDYTEFIPYTKTEMQQYAEPELMPIMKHVYPDYHTVKEDGVERLISTYPKSLAYDPTYERRSKLGQLGTRIANIFRSDEKDKNVKVRKRK